MAEIKTSDITTGVVGGTGVFDELMKAASANLDREYKDNRIRGADYAKVYLGGMETILGQSILFLLGKQKADKEAELIEEQTKKTAAEIALINAQVVKTEAESRLIEEQILKIIQETLNLTATYDKILAETSLITKQEEKIDAEINLLVLELDKVNQEILLLIAQTEKTKTETVLLSKEILKVDHEILILSGELELQEKSKQKTDAEIVYMGKQGEKIDADIANAQAQLDLIKAETDLKYEEIKLAQARISVEFEQLNKVYAEVGLLEQKTISEEQQTKDVATGGVLKAQTDLYIKQTAGFDRDAEQKAAKIVIDAGNVMYSVDDGAGGAAPVAPTGQNNIDAILAELYNGIGLTWDTTDNPGTPPTP